MAKKLGIAALVLVLLAAIGLGWIWHRLTALPDWYEDPDMIAEDGSPRVDAEWVQIPDAEPPRGAPPDAEVYVLRNPHMRASNKKSGVEKSIKQSRATYSGGKLDAGAVLNLSETDLDSLSPDEREKFEDTIEAFPALTGRDVYVGIEGGVDSGDGKLALGPDTKLRVGDSSYSLKAAAKRLGMSEAELRGMIEKELGRMDMQLPGG